MKSTIAVVICLLGLTVSACETNPAGDGNPGPGSFQGDLRNYGGADTAPNPLADLGDHSAPQR